MADRDRFTGGGFGRSASQPGGLGSGESAAEGKATEAQAVPRHVMERVKSVYAEIAAAAQESKALHERLTRRGGEDAESARVIAARLETIETQIKSLV